MICRFKVWPLQSSPLLVTAIILSVLLLEKHSPRTDGVIDDRDELSQTVEIDLRNEEKPRTDSGVGAGEKGRVGFERGSGEGSRPVPARARGGGSGGMNNPSAPSQGRLPPPSEIPAPISTTLARLPPQALPVAGIDLDPELWRKHLLRLCQLPSAESLRLSGSAFTFISS